MPPVDLFESPKLRISRAEFYFSEFQKYGESWLASDPYEAEIEREIAADGNTYDFLKIKITQHPPSNLIHCAAAVIENLRSSLDQAAYSAAVASGKTNPSQAYFPIADDETKLERDIILGRKRCKDVPVEIIDLFRRFKPYRGGNNTIWCLNKLANTSKHRLLVPVGMTTAGGTLFKNFRVVSGYCYGVGAIEWDHAKGEGICAVLKPGSLIDYEINFSLFVAFGPMDVIGGQLAAKILMHMINMVRTIVLSTETEVQRIGLAKL